MFGFPAPPLQSVSWRKGSYPWVPCVLLRILGVFSPALIFASALTVATSARAAILWNEPESTLVKENGLGSDILGGALKRDDFANDSLYFKFHVDPQSDKDTEEYFAAFELFEGNAEKLGVGNALRAWAYSAFFRTSD